MTRFYATLEVLSMAKREFPVTVQDGGEIGIESSVKLACKLLSTLISTSDGHPMLLDRLFRSR